MALTGACLVLFVTFHVLMNAVAICWPGAYNSVCQFLGANWYALIASMGLGLLFVVHIIYALVLTVQNRKARGNDRYAVSVRPKSVEWSSQNMLVLGIVVVAFLVVHLVQFWARMQAQEVMGSLYTYEGAEIPAAAGTLFLQIAFQNWWTPVIYIIGFIALWFHMNHGFWSMWQSCGWNNQIWLPRLKCIACWWTSIVIGLFTIQAIVFTVRAHENYYLTNDSLREQYVEEVASHIFNDMRLNETTTMPEMIMYVMETESFEGLCDAINGQIYQMDQHRPFVGKDEEFDKMYTKFQQFAAFLNFLNPKEEEQPTQPAFPAAPAAPQTPQPTQE